MSNAHTHAIRLLANLVVKDDIGTHAFNKTPSLLGCSGSYLVSSELRELDSELTNGRRLGIFGKILL